MGKKQKPRGQETKSGHENDLLLDNRLLLLCDFTGKIVFFKGDPKVLEIPSTSYLHKNFLSFDFTIYSRLTLASKLTQDLYQQGHLESFQLELIRSSPKNDYKPSNKTIKLPERRLRRILMGQVKLLNVNVHCIQVAFKKIDTLTKKTCEVQYMGRENGEHSPQQQFQQYDKLLMLEIDSNADLKDDTKHEIFSLSAAQIQQKIIDINYCKTNKIFKEKNPYHKVESAFNPYNFNDIAIPIRRTPEKEDKSVEEFLYSYSADKEERYFTRSRKKSNINQTFHEESHWKESDENDFLKMIDEK